MIVAHHLWSFQDCLFDTQRMTTIPRDPALNVYNFNEFKRLDPVDPEDLKRIKKLILTTFADNLEGLRAFLAVEHLAALGARMPDIILILYGFKGL